MRCCCCAWPLSSVCVALAQGLALSGSESSSTWDSRLDQER